MNKSELFARFLSLAKIHYTEERSVGFYADRLGIGTDKLSEIIWEMSDSNLTDWLETLEKTHC